MVFINNSCVGAQGRSASLVKLSACRMMSVGFRVGAGCLAHEGLMFVNRVDDFPGSGAEFFALLGF